MENTKNKNSFLITCVSCIVLLLVMCYFGINSVSYKGTSAADASYTCASGYSVIDNNGSPYCCPSGYGEDAEIISHNGSYYCVPSDVVIDASGNSDPVCVYKKYVSITLSESEKEAYTNFAFNCGSKCPGLFLEQNSSLASKFRVPYGSGWTVVDAQNSCLMPPNSDNTIECNFFDSTISKGCVTVAKTVQTEADTKKACYSYKDKRVADDKEFTVYAWLLESQYGNNSAYTLQSQYTTRDACDNANSKSCYRCENASGYNGYIHDYVFDFNLPYPQKCDKVTVDNPATSCNNLVAYTATFMNGSTVYEKEVCSASSSGAACSMPVPSAPSKSGHSFEGWGNSDGCTSGTKSAFSVTSNVTKYACFKKVSSGGSGDGSGGGTGGGDGSGGGTGSGDSSTYTISYNANGGTGSMSSHTCTAGNSCTIKSNKFVKSDHKFVGWTTNSNGTNDGYGWTNWSGTWDSSRTNGKLGISSNKLTLYAMWDKTTTDQNTDTNPQTGEITVFLIWILGLAAIVYSVWYFKSIKKVNN